MQKLALYVLIVLALGSAIGAAQTAPPPAPAAQPAPPPQPTLAPLTDNQRLRLDNIALKLGNLQLQAQAQFDKGTAPLNAERAALIAEIVKANPGYVWQDAPSPGLVPDPAAKKVEAPVVPAPKK